MLWTGLVAAQSNEPEDQPPEPISVPGGWTEGRTVQATEAGKYWGTAEPLGETDPGLVVPRVLLFLPRMALRYLVLAPIQVGANLIGRAVDSERIQAFLVGFYRTGFRPAAGLKYVQRFGQPPHTHLNLGATYGGTDFITAEIGLSRALSDETMLRGQFQLRRRGDWQFYGLGNETLKDDRALFFLQEISVRLDLERFWTPHFATRFRGGWHQHEPTDTESVGDDSVTLSDRFGADLPAGFGLRQNYLTAGIESAIENRPDTDPTRPRFLARSSAELWLSLDATDDSTLRYEVDLLAELPVYRERRFALRLRVDRAVALQDEVPFQLLPEVGRNSRMRGFTAGRYRDELLTAGSIEYRWALSGYISAALFLDIGRVFSGWDHWTLSGWRPGGGIGLEVRTGGNVLLNLQFAVTGEGFQILTFGGEGLF